MIVKSKDFECAKIQIVNKKDFDREIESLLTVLMSGNREEVRNAKKEIERLWHKETKSFKQNAYIALPYLSKFDEIKTVENQAAFASGLSLFFLVLGDKYFIELKDFTLKVIQHPNGTVREAIRKTADWLWISLSARVDPFVYPKGKQLTERQKAIQNEARNQYINIVGEIEFFIDKYQDENEDVEYIEDMKPSINKSLQLFWIRLTDNRVYRNIMEQVQPIPHQVSLKRKEIEDELLQMLKKTRSDFDIDDIKEVIYNEEGQNDLMNAVAMFDTGKGSFEISNVLETLNDAWNYFPHKILDGLSPTEKILEYQQSQQGYIENEKSETKI